jgi:hypothetical protein
MIAGIRVAPQETTVTKPGTTAMKSETTNVASHLAKIRMMTRLSKEGSASEQISQREVTKEVTKEVIREVTREVIEWKDQTTEVIDHHHDPRDRNDTVETIPMMTAQNTKAEMHLLPASVLLGQLLD